MNFYTRYEPKTFNDLVFRDQKVATKILQYTNGLRSKHLLLYGPPGSGKSKAAQIIVDTCLSGSGSSAASSTFSLAALDAHGFDIIRNASGFQKINGATRCYAIIDEVDYLKSSTLLNMRSFMDQAEYLTLVCTTNNLHKLDQPLLDRFERLCIDLPTAADWSPRAMHIMQAEGCAVSAKHLQALLNTTAYSARDLLSQLEDAILIMKRMSSPNGSSKTPSSYNIAGAPQLANPITPQSRIK